MAAKNAHKTKTFERDILRIFVIKLMTFTVKLVITRFVILVTDVEVMIILVNPHLMVLIFSLLVVFIT